LRDDGRTSVERLTAATGLAAAAVRRRLHDLRASGAVRFDVDLDLSLLQLGSPTMLWLTVDPRRIDEAGLALAAHREVAFAAATTGAASLFATAVTPGPAALHRYLTTAVAELPGLNAVATTTVLRTVKAATTRYGPRR
jgi:DNA-binding Lrp family transcriptional regulator